MQWAADCLNGDSAVRRPPYACDTCHYALTMPARLLRGDVLQCGAASAGARGRRGVCGEPAHLPLGPSRFSWPPTCCFCAFSLVTSGFLPSRSVERPGKVSSSRLLDDLRCSRPTTIDMMAIAGVHSTHPLHRVDADCVARVLQVWHGATEERFSELDCCRLNGRSA